MPAILAIPSDDELSRMSRNDLRSLAAEVGLSGARDRTAAGLRDHLSRVREGARVLKCPGCSYVWPYQGEASERASCPKCTSSVRIERNTVGATN